MLLGEGASSDRRAVRSDKGTNKMTVLAVKVAVLAMKMTVLAMKLSDVQMIRLPFGVKVAECTNH